MSATARGPSGGSWYAGVSPPGYLLWVTCQASPDSPRAWCNEPSPSLVMVDSNRPRTTAFDILTTPVTLLVGHFGAGKSEICINLAFGWRERGWDVTLIDLDLVKPYFRSRLLRDEMGAQGIHVVVPEGDRVFADLPIVVPEARAGAALASDARRKTVFDVGGAEVGSRVLGSLTGLSNPETTDVLFVVNGNRPFAETPADIVRMLRQIERTSRVAVTGLVANTHLIDETTPEVIHAGVELANQVSAETGLPVRFWAAVGDVADGVDGPCRDLPLLPMTRYITAPIGWRTGGARRRSSLV